MNHRFTALPRKEGGLELSGTTEPRHAAGSEKRSIGGCIQTLALSLDGSEKRVRAMKAQAVSQGHTVCT